MCGIVGYIGKQNGKDIVIQGLEKLEYRGYDSAGIAGLVCNDIEVFKEKGRVAALKELVSNVETSLCIGHTRWATHGVPNTVNAHPHKTYDGRFTIVHNGVIENEREIKNTILKGIEFKSETDTEVIANLIAFYATNVDVEDAIIQTINELHGTYATLILDNKNIDKMYLMKNKSPMLIGKGDGENFVASDALAMIKYTNEFYDLADKEYAILTKDTITIKDLNKQLVDTKTLKLDIDASDMDKGVYDTYMLKEIDEQASVLRKLVSEYTVDNKLAISNEIINEIKSKDKIFIVAAGTSYHSGMIGKKYFEEIASIPVEVVIASEFNYSPPLLSNNPMFIFISQSGETQDLIKAMDIIREKGIKTLCITNTKDSTLYRKSDFNLLLFAGREIAVASTKAYTSQVAVLLIIAASLVGSFNIDLIKDFSKTASVIDTILARKDDIRKMVESTLVNARNCFYIGRGIDYYTALEASLKLKEVSYIQTEGFAAGELKHGTIALIEKGTPVIGLITQDNVNLNTRSNIIEVESRGAKTLIISTSNVAKENDSFVIENVNYYMNPILTNIVTQIISYWAASLRGLDIDKPRNLAKSVTVE